MIYSLKFDALDYAVFFRCIVAVSPDQLLSLTRGKSVISQRTTGPGLINDLSERSSSGPVECNS